MFKTFLNLENLRLFRISNFDVRISRLKGGLVPDIFVSNNNKEFPIKRTEDVSSEPIFQKKEHIQKPKKPANHPHPRHPSLLTSYCDAPDNISFVGQDKDEEILLFLRKHLITNLTWFVTAIIFALAPLGVFTATQITDFSFITFPFRYILIFTIFYYFVIISYVFINFITWYYNIFLVTQKRIVDLDYSNLVYHQSAVTKLELVQDVSHSRSGFLASLFNYGDLFVQTAGNEPNLEAYSAPKPSRAAQIIVNLIGNQKKKS